MLWRLWRPARQQLLVQILYKRPEIPANCALPAIAVSGTYSKQEKAANTGSIPVGAALPCLHSVHSAALSSGTAHLGPPAWRELRGLSRVPIRPSQIAQPQTHFWYLI